MTKLTFATMLLALAAGGCFQKDCSSSDEPICYKHKCEATSDETACATWVEYCRNNPDYQGCEN